MNIYELIASGIGCGAAVAFVCTAVSSGWWAVKQAGIETVR